MEHSMILKIKVPVIFQKQSRTIYHQLETIKDRSQLNLMILGVMWEM